MSLGKKFQSAVFAIPALAYLAFSLRMAYLFYIEKNAEAIGVLGIFSIPSSLLAKFLQGDADASVWNRSLSNEFVFIVVLGLVQYLVIGMLLKWIVMRRIRH